MSGRRRGAVTPMPAAVVQQTTGDRLGDEGDRGNVGNTGSRGYARSYERSRNVRPWIGKLRRNRAERKAGVMTQFRAEEI